MKICYIASPSVHTTRWVSYFANNGHEVHLITTSKLFGEGIANVKIHLIKRYGSYLRIVNYPLNSASSIIQFRKLIKEISPDILHGHSITEATWLGAVSRFHPFVVTTWGSDILVAPKQSKVSKWIVKYVLKRADLVTCDGEHEKESLVKLDADSRRIELVGFGTNTQKFRPRRKDIDLRKRLNIYDSPTIISVRNLKPLYDIGTLVRAIPLVLSVVPDTKFIIAGNGSERKNLENLAISLGVFDSIRFVGTLSEDDLPNYLSASDIYVSTALSDGGLSASTAEAMACGLPSVITDFGDNGKWVDDGINGFLFPLRDYQTLATKIIQLLNDEELRGEFGRVSREIIVEKNDWKKEMGKMEELYKGLVRKNYSVR